MGNAPIQMGIKADKASYQYGETMTGTVYVSVSSLNETITKYRGIHLAFMGEENVEIRIREEHSAGTSSNQRTTYRSERESTNFLHVDVPLTNFDKPLRVARYEFPFEWKLPESPLPSSFRHRNQDRSGYCEVKYTISAYLVPQERQTGFFQNWKSKSGAASAFQNIQYVGPPTRTVPEPIHLAEEETIVNGLCCCWRQGFISLGWSIDSVVLTPQAQCNLQISGFNASTIPVQYLQIQLLESVHWRAGNDLGKQHTRSYKSKLVDYNVQVSHLRQWDPTDAHHQNYSPTYTSDEGQQSQDGTIITSFQVPADVKDSYQGRNCNVEHTLVVSAVTRTFATTPQVSYTLHMQRVGSGSSPAEVPMATAWMEEADYQDAVLPSDWAPDEKVPVIHLDNIAPIGDESPNYLSDTPMATAHAVMVEPSAPIEATYRSSTDDDPLAFARPPPSAPPVEEDVKHHCMGAMR